MIEYHAGVRMRLFNYTVVFEPVPEGGYNVIVPAIAEICTFGETMEEARAMAEEAIRCYIESALETEEPIPEDKEPSIERIAVQV
jgi:antitoxin HicB